MVAFRVYSDEQWPLVAWLEKLHGPGVQHRFSMTVHEEITPAQLKPPVEPEPMPPEHDIYTVRPGDSWWRISHLYGLTVDELRDLNSAAVGHVMYPGQRLRVPTIAALLESLP